MFARKDLEQDVLSGYQRYRRDLKRSQQGASPEPRIIPYIPGTPFRDGQRSPSEVVRSRQPHLIFWQHLTDRPRQSQTSEIEASYTYAPRLVEERDTQEEGETASCTVIRYMAVKAHHAVRTRIVHKRSTGSSYRTPSPSLSGSETSQDHKSLLQVLNACDK